MLSIVGILAAVAIPQFSAFRKRAFDTRAKSDLRNVALAEEAYFIDAEVYLSCVGAGCTALPGIPALSPGVTLAMVATPTGFTGSASHPKGSKAFQWDSSLGGLQGG